MESIEEKLCECGCGQKTLPAEETNKKSGSIKGQPQRYIHGHQVRTRYGISDFSKPEYTVDENGCWVWNHGTATKGYGKIKGEYAHRVFYRRYKGDIPYGMVIDHLCANRRCVNPCHLECVTDAENKHRACDIRFGRAHPTYPKCPLS